MSAKFSDAEIVSKVKGLQDRARAVLGDFEATKSRRNQFLGQQSSKQADLAKVLAEVRAAGLDPKDLRSRVETELTEFEGLLESFERDIRAVNQAYDELESKQ